MAFANWMNDQELNLEELIGIKPEPSPFAFTQGNGAGGGFVDPALVHILFGPVMQVEYNPASTAVIPGAIIPHSNDDFLQPHGPLHSDFCAVELSTQAPGMPNQDLYDSYGKAPANAPLPQIPSMPGQDFTGVSIPVTTAFPQAPIANSGDFACTHLGCDKKFTRRPDMLRHAKVHDPNTQRFDCPFAGCLRKGPRGFPRRDKLVAHEKAHRRAIQKAQDRATRQQ